MRAVKSIAFVVVVGAGALVAGQEQAGRGGRQAGPPSMGGGQCANNPYNCPDTPNPFTTPDTVWLEEI